MQVSLIVPGPLSTVSGGHTYDRRMADGLRALGHDVSVVELDGRLPDPDQAAIYGKVLTRGFGFEGYGPASEIVTVVTGPMYHSAPNAYGLFAARVGATVIL